MKNWFLALAGMLLTAFLMSACQRKESTEGLVEILDSNFYFRLPENYGVVSSTSHRMLLQEGVKIEGTVFTDVSPSNFVIWIGPTTFEVSEFQRGPLEFNPIDRINDNFSEPKRIDSDEFEIFITKDEERKPVQFLVRGFVFEGRTGIGIEAHGDFSSQGEAYLVVKEILESVRKIND